MKANSYKVIHNGYKIDFLDSMEQVDELIETRLAPYNHLRPQKIMDRTLKTSGNKKMRLVRYVYHTLYEEDFIIDYEC